MDLVVFRKISLIMRYVMRKTQATGWLRRSSVHSPEVLMEQSEDGSSLDLIHIPSKCELCYTSLVIHFVTVTLFHHVAKLADNPVREEQEMVGCFLVFRFHTRHILL